MSNSEAQEELFAVIEQNPDKPDAYWPLIVEFVAEWLNAQGGMVSGWYTKSAAELWREEMS